MTINPNFKVFDVAQVGDDGDAIQIVNNVEKRVMPGTPTFDSSEIDHARQLCSLLSALYHAGVANSDRVPELTELVKSAFQAGADKANGKGAE